MCSENGFPILILMNLGRGTQTALLAKVWNNAGGIRCLLNDRLVLAHRTREKWGSRRNRRMSGRYGREFEF
jgi:hypothetical protein